MEMNSRTLATGITNSSDGLKTKDNTLAQEVERVKTRELLTIVLPAKKENEARYAVMPFPKTYEDALLRAIDLLGKHMVNPTPDSLILRCAVEDQAKSEPVWAVFDPKDWNIVVRPGDKLSISEKLPDVTVSELPFLIGHVLLTVGKKDKGITKWTGINFSTGRPDSFAIDRPKSYEEACQLVKETTIPPFQPAAADLKKAVDFDFYFFRLTAENTRGTDFWEAFPPAAYTDANIWHATVPLPQQILGVIVRNQAETYTATSKKLQ